MTVHRATGGAAPEPEDGTAARWVRLPSGSRASDMLSAMLSTDCPRCRVSMQPVRLSPRHGGAYREAAGGRADELGWQCPACEVGFVPGSLVGVVMKRMPVGGGPAERHRRKGTTSCPGCFATFDALVLEWAEELVELERCPRCGGMLLDPGELPKVFDIERRARETLP